jgi:hypothetical protein
MSSRRYLFAGNIRDSAYVSSLKRPIPPYQSESNTDTYGLDFRQHRILRISFWIKLAFILLEVCLAIGFGACNFKKAYNAAAVLEWAIAFIFTFYVFSFFIDLLPAVRTKDKAKRFGSGGAETEMQMEQNDHVAQGYERENDSQRTMGRNDVMTVNSAKYGVNENGNVQAPLPSNF